MAGYSPQFPFHRTHVYLTPRALRPSGPKVFWPVVLLLGSLAVALTCWGAYASLPGSPQLGGNSLRIAAFLPTFKEEPQKPPEEERDELPEPIVIANATDEPPLLPLPPPVVVPAPKPAQVELPKAETPKAPMPFEFPALPPIETPLPAPRVEQPVPPPVFVPAPVPMNEPVAAPTAGVVSVKLVVPDYPSIYPLVFCDSDLGDTPMLRNWKSLALFSLMTSAVYVQVPAPVAAQDKTVSEAIAELKKSLEQGFQEGFKNVRSDITGLTTQIQALKDDVKRIEEDALAQRLKTSNTNQKILDIEKSLGKIRDDIDDLKTKMSLGAASKATGADRENLEEIKTKLGAIEQAILKLQPGQTRVAMAAPVNQTGKVTLANLYTQDLLFVVNGKGYRVAPNTTVAVDVPAGGVVYELISDFWGSRGRNSSSVAAGEVLTLTAR